ncbi:MAG: methyltransferase [Clostridia bacterium]|nr:methyltransferase [Clostridia bacterium]
MKVCLEENEKIEDLQCKDLKIIQNKKLYNFTSDSVVLANYVKTKPSDIAVEIGTGSGVISILVQAKNNLKKIYAFEIQEQMQKLANKNVEFNDLSEKISVVCDDIKNFAKHFPKNSIDVVFSNPPYFKTTNFKQNEVKKCCKEEVLLSCEQLCIMASAMLKNGGEFYCCYGAERSCELICNLNSNNLAVKEMFFTENGKGEVKLVVLKAVKGGKNGVKVLPNLVTNEENGNYLESLQTKHFIND